MDTRQLRYFVQIVESGSLSKASRQLFVAQPALSAHVARLEEEVGKPLLVRSVRGVVPTENGLALYQHAKFVLRQLDEAVFVARQEQSAIKGRVKLGLAPSSACMIGLPQLKHLRATYPGISLNVVAALPAFLEDMARLAAGRRDPLQSRRRQRAELRAADGGGCLRGPAVGKQAGAA